MSSSHRGLGLLGAAVISFVTTSYEDDSDAPPPTPMGSATVRFTSRPDMGAFEATVIL